ncbi:MAG: cytidine deaminase [Rikenellaceae bacterium]
MEKTLNIKYEQIDQLDLLNASDRELLEAARAVAGNSVSPYSNFSVGAAARMSSGEIVTGANVESEVYPAGLCAERNLLFHTAISHPKEAIETLVVTSISTDDECYPCGFCRQVLLDTERRQGSPIRVIMAGSSTATIVESASTLTPFAFKL